MKPLVRAVVVACCVVPAQAAAQSLTAAEIDAAILAGQNGRQRELVFTCEAMIGFREMFRAERPGLNPTGSFEVTLSLTTGRIALLSAAAKRFYKPYPAAAVPADLKTLAAVLDAEPREPFESSTSVRSFFVASPIEQIVIKTWPRGDRVVLPNEFKTEAVKWQNVGGNAVAANRARARFPVGQIRELPPGELEVVVVTKAGDRNCSMPSRDRRRVFGR